jgi:hypothetical protein
MMRSANEVMALAVKAARGAGAPPAQASQFGTVAVVHLCAGRRVEVLNAALSELPTGPIIEIPLAFMRVLEGAQDGRAAGAFDIAAKTLGLSYVEALPYRGHVKPDGLLHLDVNVPAVQRPVLRIDLAPEIYSQWTALAARLLVPESDTSRQSGAGADPR